MREAFEKLIVHHTSATLKGYKAGSLFTYRPSGFNDFQTVLSSLDRAFSDKGVRICMIDRKKGARQIFVYRPKMIEAMLDDCDLRCFLCGLGYPVDEGHEANIAHLLKKMEENNTFPHELGLFLGYPLEDVTGFIANKGKGYTLCGLWKVYSQPERARERFDLFKRCREHCLECFRQGQSVLQLIYAD
ncbi:MAG: DUF3793 family protein [Ruminococcaceae bacterium]|nr:DUF3793 family protein [Oscillospiraceae bacterium]